MSYQNSFPVEKKTSILAILSTISGAASFFVVPFIGAVAALITGYMAKTEIKKSNGMVEGEGFATAGIVMGYINLGLSLMVCCLIILAVVLTGAFSMQIIK
ncbi:MAG TPA: DUF4190 domain-containing protein [Anaerolineaceae bacterium]|nr:DUF4190 domain-containing protein [Anaerolineaceae bacterium]